jgi:hypothetical protein
MTGVAIIPVFLVNPPFDGWDKNGPSPSLGCLACGKGEASNGGKLLECSFRVEDFYLIYRVFVLARMLQ